MPIRSRINALPTRVRAQLDRRLIASDFGDLIAAAAWLHSKGHQVGKSAVGEYAKRLKLELEAEAQTARAVREAPGAVALRLSCLQAAAQAPGSAVAVVKRAETYATWAKTGRSPGARR